jgi:hypothetical protein
MYKVSFWREILAVAPFAIFGAFFAAAAAFTIVKLAFWAFTGVI